MLYFMFVLPLSWLVMMISLATYGEFIYVDKNGLDEFLAFVAIFTAYGIYRILKKNSTKQIEK